MNGSLSLSSLLSMAVALLAGAAVPFQGGSNAALGRMLGHPLWATLTSLLVSIVVVLPLLFVMRVPAPTVGAAVQGPAWLWLGGVAGVAYLTAALVLTPAGRGQLHRQRDGGADAGVAGDRPFRSDGIGAQAHRAGRLVGVGLILVGAGIVQAHSVAAPPPIAGSVPVEQR